MMMTHLEKICELLPRCALYLLGSYCWIRSLALEVLAYGYKISFSRGSRCVLFRNSTNWAAVINLRLEVPPHLKTSQLNVCMFFVSGLIQLLQQFNISTCMILSSFHTFTLPHNSEGDKHLVVLSLCMLWLYVHGNFKELQTKVSAVSYDQMRIRNDFYNTNR